MKPSSARLTNHNKYAHDGFIAIKKEIINR